MLLSILRGSDPKNVVLRETHWSPRLRWYGHDAGPALLSHLGSCLQDQRVAATTAARSCGDFQRAQLGRLGFSPGLQLPKSEDLVQGVDTSTKAKWHDVPLRTAIDSP